MHFIKLDCSSAWVEGKVIETVKLLRSNLFPSPSFKCEYCNYLKSVGSVIKLIIDIEKLILLDNSGKIFK